MWSLKFGCAFVLAATLGGCGNDFQTEKINDVKHNLLVT
jgi:hypothetical protein